MVKLPPSSRGLPAISVQQPSVPSVVKPPERPPSTLSVEPQELIDRAKDLAEAMPQWPDDAPTAPCELAMVFNAATVLQRSAHNVSMALKTGEERWRRLAELLVHAAIKYDGVDSEAANKLTSAMPAFSATLRRPSAYQLRPDAVGSYVPPPTSPSWLGDGTRALVLQADNVFLRVRDAAKQINAGDARATALFRFADNWGAYEGKLRDAALRFRPFESWRGAAVTQVEKQFELHRVWLNQMAANCALLSQQARALASAHCVAVVQHPRPEQVEPLHTKLTSKRISSRDYEAYKRLQKMSEDVRVEYRKQAGLPWSVINLSMPPDRADADLLKTPEEKAQEIADRSQQRAMQPMQAMLKAQKEEAEKGREEARKARQEAQEEARKAREEAQDIARQAQKQAQEQQKAATANFAKSMSAQQAALAKSAGAGMPKLPLPSPSKLMGAAGQFANMAKGVGPKPAAAGPTPGAPLIPPLPPGGHPPHLAPAASAGAGAGIPLGGSGIGTPPRLQPPLQPPNAAQPPTGLQMPKGQIAMDPESVARSAAGSGLHGASSGTPGTAGAMGGGAAMGGLGAGQNKAGGTAKRVQPDDAAVYTEERPWTEGVIGRRPRKVDPAPPAPPADGAK
ncbi:MAG: PPE domain-containing protein [Actinomycetota bacterium]|uniref:Alanine and glycine rich protein n=1 Tax=Mycobacterium lentiflavum TaxID=141349 RepID=A0ABY3UYK8_MYCLN|nr:PPE domain-containing protein [Mycobacterium lentiflavum]MEE3062380.1 PPE domain-containing protein [Actinomycetota bacterium]ULP44648.1 hypothetical protein MJO58_12465 [Mycobacterium lentiflavum]